MTKRLIIIITCCIIFLFLTGFTSIENTTLDKINERLSVDVPILMYHHLTNEKINNSDAVVNYALFNDQMTMLSEQGYTTIFFRDLIDYVETGRSLPEKPILITFDDGYLSNLTLALPILQEHNMRATIFIIGCSVGKATYKDTNIPIIPHFSFEQLIALNSEKYIDIQSHSYDMHQVLALDGKIFREGILPKKDESNIEYINNLSEDLILSRQEIETHTRGTVNVFSYPFGKYTGLSEQVLRYHGFKVTVTTNTGINRIHQNDPDCLYRMKRINVHSNYSAADLLQILKSY